MSTIDWLIENGGPVVRYRTACELLNDAGLAESLSEELLRFDVVQQWLSYLPSDISDRRPRGKGVHSIFGMGVHGGGNDKLETILGVLLNLGLHAGLAELDEKIEPYMRWLEEAVERSQEHPFSSFPISIIASRLASLGYKSRAIDTARAMRLSAILEFVRMGSFDIYVEWGGRHKRPEHSKNRQLINPELYKDGRFRLPWHHDIYLFGVEPDETKQAVTSVVECISSPEFQRLPWGYGELQTSTGYMASGWSPHLACFFNNGVPQNANEGVDLIASLLMMAPFESSNRHTWFQGGIDHLDTFANGDHYQLPRSYLPEKKFGYWPSAHMALENPRRTNLAIGLESTFWMMKIKTGIV